MRDFREFKKSKRDYYLNLSPIYSPALGDEVRFTASGFHHLVYKNNPKGKQNPRTVSEQILKLSYLEYVPKVIEGCRAVDKSKVYNDKNIFHYALVYEVKPKVYVRVIIEKRGNGGLRFLSVMPHNNKSKTKKRPRGRPSVCLCSQLRHVLADEQLALTSTFVLYSLAVICQYRD